MLPETFLCIKLESASAATDFKFQNALMSDGLDCERDTAATSVVFGRGKDACWSGCPLHMLINRICVASRFFGVVEAGWGISGGQYKSPNSDTLLAPVEHTNIPFLGTVDKI